MEVFAEFVEGVGVWRGKDDGASSVMMKVLSPRSEEAYVTMAACIPVRALWRMAAWCTSEMWG